MPHLLTLIVAKKMDAVDVPTTCLDYEAVNFFVRLLFNHPAAI